MQNAECRLLNAELLKGVLFRNLNSEIRILLLPGTLESLNPSNKEEINYGSFRNGHI